MTVATKQTNSISVKCPLCNASLTAETADVTLERRVHWSGAGGEWFPVIKCTECSYAVDVPVSKRTKAALVNHHMGTHRRKNTIDTTPQGY